MVKRNPDIAFTRNPIFFRDHSQGIDFALRFFVSVGEQRVYEGHYFPPADIDVSEIAEAYVAPIPSPEGFPMDEYGALLRLEDADEFGKRLVSVSDSRGVISLTPFFALPGGISPQNYRRLNELDTDIFEARLLNKRRNFFLTTRTHGWRIVMDEYELYPLTFVNLHDEDTALTVKPPDKDFEVSLGNIQRGIYAIDFSALRRKIATEYGFMASVFEVRYDGNLSCQIVIRDTPPERHCTLVKFRNSLGAFELLHLYGEKESGATPQEAGETGKQYDSVSGRYVNFRGRQTLQRTIDVNTGFKTDDEIRFILDMVTSSEVYLQDSAGWVKVIPSIEKSTLQSPQLKPESLKVKFTISDEYDNQTPDINDLRDLDVPRIFTDQHTDQFN